MRTLVTLLLLACQDANQGPRARAEDTGPAVCPPVEAPTDTASPTEGSPEVLLDCPASPLSQIVVPFDASASDEAWPGGALIYEWSVTDSPAHWPLTLLDPQSPSPSLMAAWIGAYTVSLTVRDPAGPVSAPAQCTVEQAPPRGLLVELWWGISSRHFLGMTLDLDLHMLRGDVALYDGADGAWWYNSGELNWGDPSLSTDDPVIFDVIGASIPEQGRLVAPEAGVTYTFAVVGIDGDAGIEPTTAYMRIWLDGALIAEETAVMDVSEVWTVGRLTDTTWVSDGNVGSELHTGP
jgi:hypothetical protein